MARYLPPSSTRQRLGTAVFDANSCAGVLALALCQPVDTDRRGAVEAGVNAGPFRSRRRFGGDEWGKLRGRESMERDEGAGR